MTVSNKQLSLAKVGPKAQCQESEQKDLMRILISQDVRTHQRRTKLPPEYAKGLEEPMH